MYDCTKHFYYCLNTSLKKDSKVIEKSEEIIGLFTKYLDSFSLTQCCATFQLLITIDCFSKEQTKKLILMLL